MEQELNQNLESVVAETEIATETEEQAEEQVVQTEANETEPQAVADVETDDFDIAKILKELNLDNETEPAEPVTETKSAETLKTEPAVPEDKSSKAFADMRIQIKAKETEAETHKIQAAELEEKLDLFAQYLAENMQGYDGDKSKALAFIEKAQKEQYQKLKGVPPDVAKKYQAIEEENLRLKNEALQRQQAEEKSQLVKTVTDKANNIFTTLKTNKDEMDKAFGLYQKAFGIDLTEVVNFVNADMNAFKYALSIYRKTQNPNLIVKKPQAPQPPDEKQEVSREQALIDALAYKKPK